MKKISALFLAVLLILTGSCKKVSKLPETFPDIPMSQIKEPDLPKTLNSAYNYNASKTLAPSNIDLNVNLSNKTIPWGLGPNKNHVPPSIPKEHKAILDKYSGYYLGDTSQKVIYLTFDEGYEVGYTSVILDVLKANDVKAAFFVTGHYIKSQPELIKRMVEEGHLVCSHSLTHPSMPSKANSIDAFNKEFAGLEDLFKEITGLDMPKFFRPPKGEFSEKVLYLTQKLGYKTVFWSFAYKDWLVDEQPTEKYAHDKIVSSSHNGEIMLLHAVSKTNANVLDSVIKELKSEGYRFGTLYELK
ncbi:peptidoglycan-N-acetylmuramic acid deacetylase [Caloramator quimbayensis]|uniref:Peptidoglycan-N-acetylmuramic acid deacetylase n=1 Tax=Caloramator quimbayensis TaxID=1147123 RepID=A0A1T4WQQ9_9CLOT|nr:delta-lactam-biosynthetic de-N-acetylase [Caloramator quimbayensis]SKA79694.1 peptidoglycan-N-acetylmuramic acid deacetylase [Caloramator quimbayensis]